jgi:hypothetical protein
MGLSRQEGDIFIFSKNEEKKLCANKTLNENRFLVFWGPKKFTFYVVFWLNKYILFEYMYGGKISFLLFDNPRHNFEYSFESCCKI